MTPLREDQLDTEEGEHWYSSGVVDFKVFHDRSFDSTHIYRFVNNHRKDSSVYWDSGVLLKDCFAEPEKYDGSEWEILFHPDDIVSQRRVSKKRILDHAKDDYERDSLDTLLRRW